MNDIFNDLYNKEKKLTDQLIICPMVEITGLVGIGGVGAGKIGSDVLWSMTMKFDAWRIDSDLLRTDTLIVRRQVSDTDLEDLQKRITAESVVKIHARVSDDNPQALLEDVIQVGFPDIELENYLVELKKPITYKDEVFGLLTYDRQVNWYSVNVNWIDKSIKLNLSLESTDGLESALRIAHILYNDKIIWDNRVKDYAVHKLLPLKNESWLEEDETEVTEIQFKKRMSLESITVYPDGSFEFWHDDGDLFWGHSILISGDLEKGPADADIPG